MKEQKINHIAAWLSVLAIQVLSILWYSPILFAEKWMAYLGKRFSDFGGESLSGLLFSLTGAIISSYFLAWLYTKLHVRKGFMGLVTAITIAVSCFAFTTFTQDSFSLRPPGLSLINVGSVLINFGVVGLLLGSWPKYVVNTDQTITE